MFISNLDELVATLRPRLRDYLAVELDKDLETGKRFCCFAHQEKTPSMIFNPKHNYETVHCFSGCGTFDIFRACSELEGLPASGPEWVTVTLPHLANKLEIEVKLGEPSPEQAERMELFRLADDIANILADNPTDPELLKLRGWSDEHLTIGSVDADDLFAELVHRGWDTGTIVRSLMIRSARQNFFGKEKITFAIRDYSGRAVGFISRNPDGSKPKYINCGESAIYKKREALVGLDIALKTARRQGLYVVEGSGDLATMHKHGILNVVAICGTAFTGDHLTLLKMLGINKVYFCLDWDKAGIVATHRILKEELRFAPGVSCFVVGSPGNGAKDVGELLQMQGDSKGFQALERQPAFEWALKYISENMSPEAVCEQMVPLIASEPSAVRRELLVGKIADFTKISANSIAQDVAAIRDHKAEERQSRVSAAVDRYQKACSKDPGNVLAHMAKHKDDLERIDSSYKKKEIGAAYQIGRFDALQEAKQLTDDGTMTEFIMKHHKQFADALSGGMAVTSGTMILCGGDANAAKTAYTISLTVDIALHDPNAVAVLFSTDDSYAQIEPRLLTNIAAMQREQGDAVLDIGMAANPFRQATSQRKWDAYHRAVATLRQLLYEEKLVVLDAEDGSNLTTLERNLNHIRKNFPKHKLWVAVDSPYNLSDYGELDQTSRMRNIATHLKRISGQSRCCVWGTAEYRKSASSTDTKKIKWPTNDDIADARAMKYRPSAIFHVYNDLHTRVDDAEIFWLEGGERRPRLAITVGKNKISKFKDKLMMDLDINTVALFEKDVNEARREAAAYLNVQEESDGEDDSKVTWVTSSWEPTT